MTKVWLKFIEFYQRFVSPYKGFHCAHHALHKGDTCSNAVKKLIADNGLLKSLPRIRLRFKECQHAHQIIKTRNIIAQRADIACDIPCDISIGDCGGASKTSPCDAAGDCANCIGSCPFDVPKLSRKTWRRIILVCSVVAVFISYWTYGRGISSVELSEISVPQGGFFTQLTHRDLPKLRVKITVDDQIYLSEIRTFHRSDSQIRLSFDRAPLSYHIDKLEILDTRINIGNNRLAVSQVLDKVINPEKQGEGNRYQYIIQRHWHFW